MRSSAIYICDYDNSEIYVEDNMLQFIMRGGLSSEVITFEWDDAVNYMNDRGLCQCPRCHEWWTEHNLSYDSYEENISDEVIKRNDAFGYETFKYGHSKHWTDICDTCCEVIDENKSNEN